MRKLVVAVCLLTGCAFTNRPMLLKEFSASHAESAALKGKKIYVHIRDERADLDTKWKGTKPAKLKDFKYKKMSGEDEDAWDDELNAIKEKTTEKDWHQLGWVRNGYGMRTAKVYSVNPPPEWLKQIIELELEGQGAIAMRGAGGADIVINATIRFLRQDMYWKHWCDLVVDFELRTSARGTVRKTLHTNGGRTAWSSSSFEYYSAVRECGQKMIALLIAELAAKSK